MKSDRHETWKCADPELERQIRCFPYGERSDVPRLQQVEQKAVGWQRNLGLTPPMRSIKIRLSGILLLPFSPN